MEEEGSDTQKMPTDPISLTQEGMIHLHQVFLNLLLGGFSESQAADVIAAILMKAGKEDSDG